MLTVQSFVNSPVTSNCYVLFDRDFGNECIIIDPGSRSEKELIDYLVGESLVPKFIILTHEHFDHCWGVNELVERYNIPIICSQLCAEAVKFAKRNCSAFYDNKESFIICKDTITTEELDFVLQFARHEIRFFPTPGHTDASICFCVEKCLFTGDTLIKNKKTIVKLPTGSVEKLNESFKLFALMKGGDYLVYPGHGEKFLLGLYDLMNSH